MIASFIPMDYLHVTSNIMSLGGLALAIGVLVDAAVVMVENGYRHLSERNPHSHSRSSNPATDSANPGDSHLGVAEQPATITERERRKILLDAAKQVGPAIFFSLLIIVVSFLPVFLLEAQEGCFVHWRGPRLWPLRSPRFSRSHLFRY